jgi:hypothetical protein
MLLDVRHPGRPPALATGARVGDRRESRRGSLGNGEQEREGVQERAELMRAELMHDRER